MKLPILTKLETTRDMIDVFKGYNHNLRIGEGEFYDMQNLTSDYYPVLSPRNKRGIYAYGENINAVTGKDHLVYVAGDSIVFNGVRVNMGLSTGQKTLVPFGAYIIVMPDKKYINTTDFKDYGNIESSFYSPSTIWQYKNTNGVYYFDFQLWEEGEDLTDGILRFNGSVMEQYHQNGDYWKEVPIVCKIFGKNIPKLDGFVYIKAYGNDYGEFKVLECLDDSIEVLGFAPFITNLIELYIERKMPDMDFLVEAGNRLWGCKYGYNESGEFVNELYASKLGDFKMWKTFKGISTDSYVASVGTDGEFTGAINYLGNAVFFKEKHVHRVYGDFPANFQIETNPCVGVQKGCDKSLAIVNGMLYYKGKNGIVAYNGSSTQQISQVFGSVSYSKAVGCGCADKYYVSLKKDAESNISKEHFKIGDTLYVLKVEGNVEHESNDTISLTQTEESDFSGYELFVYDTAKGLWHKETNENGIIDMCAHNNNVYFVDGTGTKLYSVKDYGWEGEKSVKWFAETGIFGLTNPDKKYIGTINVRMSLSYNSNVSISIQYDSNGVWEQINKVFGTNLQTVNIYIKPKRCDHFRLRIDGVGEAKIYSITKSLEGGSEV